MEIRCEKCKKMFRIRPSRIGIRKHCSMLCRSAFEEGGGLDGSGYRVLFRNRKLVRQHRLVMEKILGRRLSTDECVHHRDGNKQNNDPKNLEILSRSEHTKKHLLELKQSGELNRLRRKSGKKNRRLDWKIIRSMLSNGQTVLSIAREFGCGRNAIYYIKEKKYA